MVLLIQVLVISSVQCNTILPKKCNITRHFCGYLFKKTSSYLIFVEVLPLHLECVLLSCQRLMAVVFHNVTTCARFKSPYNTANQMISQSSSKLEYVCRIIHIAPVYDSTLFLYVLLKKVKITYILVKLNCKH